MAGAMQTGCMMMVEVDPVAQKYIPRTHIKGMFVESCWLWAGAYIYSIELCHHNEGETHQGILVFIDLNTDKHILPDPTSLFSTT